MLAEARGVFELNSSLLLSPLLLRAPKGDGHPVLALPGFLASDISMAPMRRYLKELGYDTYAWHMGRNFGGVASQRGALRDLCGRSMRYRPKGQHRRLEFGGVYARDLALQLPDMVLSVITLGSPLPTTSLATNATRLYEALSGEGANDNPETGEAIACDMPVPATSIYSRTDGIVNGVPACFARRRLPKILRSISQAISALASTRPPRGRWPTGWRSRKASSSNLIGPGRLPLHMGVPENALP